MAPLAGAVEYRGDTGEPMLAAVLHGYVRGSVESWQYMLDHLGRFFERALATPAEQSAEVPEKMEDLPQEFVRLLGTRTAELHLALAARPEDPVFSPEPFTDFHRHGLYHGSLPGWGGLWRRCGDNWAGCRETVQADAQAVLERQGALREKLRFMRDTRIMAARIRVHGIFTWGRRCIRGRISCSSISKAIPRGP